MIAWLLFMEQRDMARLPRPRIWLSGRNHVRIESNCGTTEVGDDADMRDWGGNGMGRGTGLPASQSKRGERAPTQATGSGRELGMLVRLDWWKREGEVAGRVGQR